jgi:hypothetical protein
MFKFDVTFSDDLKSATVKFPAEIQASADDFRELIGVLASVRSKMLPAIPAKPPEGMIQAIDDPKFWVAPDVMRGGTRQVFQSPGTICR